MFFKNKKYFSSLLFIAGFLAVCLFYQYPNILFLRPQSIHQWRQTNCTSMILNYYQGGMQFFKPAIHHLFSDNGATGNSVAEFPVLYYLSASLWKIFGIHEFIPRIINILILFFGLFALFKTAEKLLADTFWGICIALLIFTSPVIVFYGLNFMPDVPAFALALVAWYCFYEYGITGKIRWLYTAMFFFLFSGLIKISSLIGFTALAIIFVMEWTGIVSLKTREKIFRSKKHSLISFSMVVILVFSWYLYAEIFNRVHGGRVSDMTIWPIWQMDREGIKQVIKGLNDLIIHQLFSSHSLYVFSGLFIAILLSAKKMNRFLFFTAVFIFLGCTAYFLLWFQVWQWHDYYLTPLVMVVVFICISFFYFLYTNYPGILKSIMAKGVFLVFLIYNIVYCGNNIRMRYGIGVTYPELTASRVEVGYWNWMHDYYKRQWEAFETISSYNREIGIRPEDLVLNIPDPSHTFTLYMMNQKGWTNLNNQLKNPEAIYDKIKIGAKYLFVSDTAICGETFIQPFIQHRMGTYKNVAIYDLKDATKNQINR